MRAVDTIRKKRDGLALSAQEIHAFVHGAVSGDWPSYQVAALLMAIVLRGMDDGETAELTRAMVASGVKLDWSDLPGPVVDKHSTGGVGDKTSLVLAPLAAACGVFVPMMSGRGLGHSGGTLDKLEAIPGFRTGLSLEEMRPILRHVGCVLISPTDRIAPADRVLYQLRDVTATVECIPLLASSIMSKKIAEGIHGLVMDVKCGAGAFMRTREGARQLARTILAIGSGNGVRTEALLTSMNHPLGRLVGNALEVHEAIEVLSGRGPADVRELSVQLAARMVLFGQTAATLAEAEGKVRQALDSGQGLEKFRQIITQQGGDPRVIDDPDRLLGVTHRAFVRAQRSGYYAGCDAFKLGLAVVALGAGRDRVEDRVDPAVGAIMQAACGQQVETGDVLVELLYRDPHRVGRAMTLVENACQIVDAPVVPEPLILEVLV